jgi:hypothetical protein
VPACDLGFASLRKAGRHERLVRLDCPSTVLKFVMFHLDRRVVLPARFGLLQAGRMIVERRSPRGRLEVGSIHPRRPTTHFLRRLRNAVQVLSSRREGSPWRNAKRPRAEGSPPPPMLDRERGVRVAPISH